MAQALSDAGWRSRARLWALLSVGVMTCGAYRAISEWRERHAFLINMTDSLPNWAFLIEQSRTPARGDYIFFMPPPNALVTRHFGARLPLFGKLVYGMPGDRIDHVNAEVLINGRPVARMKPRSRLGERLMPGPTGIIPESCYYVGTPHRDGFDSRYADIGLVCARQIIGTGEPLL